MIIYARGIKFKTDLIFFMIFITSFIIFDIISLQNKEYNVFIISTIFLTLNISALLRLYKKCYIKFNKNNFEYHTVVHKKLFGTDKPRINEIKFEKKKIFYIEYNDIIEWGNIKYLSKNFANNRIWNIGFITNNKKYYILTNEYSEKQLNEIINILKSKIAIPPIKEIIIDKDTYKNTYPRAFNE